MGANAVPMDQLAALFAGKKLQLDPGMAANALGGNPNFNTGQPAPAATPTAVPASPAPTPAPAPANPAAPTPSYAQPSPTTRLNRPDAAPPDLMGLGVATPAAPPNLPTQTPMQSLVGAQPHQDMTPFQQRQADMKARQDAVADKGNQPRWYERLLAGLAAGMINYGGHNPEGAARAAEGINDRRMNRAIAPIDARLATDETDINTAQQEYGQKRQTWQDALHAQEAGALESDREAQAQERVAQAGKYENMNPTQRAAKIPELEKALGMPLDPEERKYFVANGKIPQPEKTPAVTNDFESIHAEAARRFPGDPQKAYDWEQGQRESIARASRTPAQPKEPTEFGTLYSQAVKENGGKPLSVSQIQGLHKSDDGMTASQKRMLDMDSKYKSADTQIAALSKKLADNAAFDPDQSSIITKNLLAQLNGKIAEKSARQQELLGDKKVDNAGTTPVQSNVKPVAARGAQPNANKAQVVHPATVRQYARSKGITFAAAKTALEDTGKYKVTDGGQ